MPGMYPAGEYDLAGFAWARSKKQDPDRQNVQAGDVVLGLASHGVHSNGFSPVRKCIERASSDLPATLDGQPFKQAIMAPTRLYVKNVLAALAQHPIKGWPTSPVAVCWRTSRVLLPEGGCPLAKGSWPQTELFAWLQKTAASTTTK